MSGEVTAPQVLTLQPSETATFEMDFSGLLSSTDSIASVVQVISEKVGGGASGLTIGAPTISDNSVLFDISGTVHRQRYRIQVDVIFASGSHRSGDGILKGSTK